jgi:hypothetical protein
MARDLECSKLRHSSVRVASTRAFPFFGSGTIFVLAAATPSTEESASGGQNMEAAESTASVVVRQQNLKKLMEQLQSIRLSIQSDPFLKSLCEHEHSSLQNTVSTALSLYNMFERKNALHSEHTALGFFGLLPDELFMHVLSFLPPTTLCFSRRSAFLAQWIIMGC